MLQTLFNGNEQLGGLLPAQNVLIFFAAAVVSWGRQTQSEQ